MYAKVTNICQYICHQKTKRSFIILKHQIPLCARCMGIYFGYIIGLITILIVEKEFIFNHIFIIIIITLLTYLDGFIQYRTKYESNNIFRLITGTLSGTATIYLIFFFL